MALGSLCCAALLFLQRRGKILTYIDLFFFFNLIISVAFSFILLRGFLKRRWVPNLLSYLREVILGINSITVVINQPCLYKRQRIWEFASASRLIRMCYCWGGDSSEEEVEAMSDQQEAAVALLFWGHISLGKLKLKYILTYLFWSE